MLILRKTCFVDIEVADKPPEECPPKYVPRSGVISLEACPPKLVQDKKKE